MILKPWLNVFEINIKSFYPSSVTLQITWELRAKNDGYFKYTFMSHDTRLKAFFSDQFLGKM